MSRPEEAQPDDLPRRVCAHTGVLNALREDQLSLRAEMGEMRAEMRGEIDELRQETRQGFEETRRQFATVHTGLARIVTLIEGIS